jgi:hypothetical protein
MFCGPTEFDFYELDKAVKVLKARSDRIGAWWPAVLLEYNALNPEFFAERLFEWKNLASLIGYNPEAAKMFGFHGLLRESQRFHASVPRDKIFALRSLCQLCPSRSFDIVPDYSVSEVEVWTLYTREAIVSSKGFDILSFAKGTSESQTTIPELPSWSISPDFGIPIIRNAFQSTFDTARGMSLKLIHDLSDCKRLKVKGIMFAPVNFVSVAPSNRPFPGSLLWHHLEVLEVLKRLPPKYKHMSGQSRGESVWRTLCADGTGTHRLTTAPFSYGERFKKMITEDVDYEARQIAKGKGQKNMTLSQSMEGFGSASPSMSSSNDDPPPRHNDTVSKQDWTLSQDVLARLNPVFETLDELADGESIPDREDVARACTQRTAEKDDNTHEAVGNATSPKLPERPREQTSETPQEIMDTRTYGERLIDEMAARDSLDDTAALRSMKNIERQEERFLKLKELEKDESFGFIRASAVLRSGRTMFVTENEAVGLGSTEMLAGDEVWIIAGSQLPLVLRPHAGADVPRVGDIKTYRFVCQAYVHGIMNGEAVAQSKIEDWQELHLL